MKYPIKFSVDVHCTGIDKKTDTLKYQGIVCINDIPTTYKAIMTVSRHDYIYSPDHAIIDKYLVRQATKDLVAAFNKLGETNG